MKAHILIAALAATLALPAAAQDWQPLPAGQEQVVLADASSVARNGVAATLRVLETFAHTQTIGDDAYPHRSRTLNYVFNCVEHTYAVTGWKMFDGTLGQGNVVWRGRIDDPSFLRIDAGAEQAALLSAACGTTAVVGTQVPSRAN